MIYVVIPVYNESLNIANLRKELSQVLRDEEVYYVFSDDGSVDDTVEQLQKEFNGTKFTILGDGINRGPGAAFERAFVWVLNTSKSERDLVVSIEADCTSDLGILSGMVSLARMNFDLVLASVYAQSGAFEKTTFLRRLISSIANLMMRFVFNIRVLTLSSFYRVYTIGILRKIQTAYGRLIDEQGFICMLEILLKAIRLDARIIEVPTTLRSSKRLGRSKMKVLSTSIQYISFLLRKGFQNRKR